MSNSNQVEVEVLKGTVNDGKEDFMPGRTLMINADEAAALSEGRDPVVRICGQEGLTEEVSTDIKLNSGSSEDDSSSDGSTGTDNETDTTSPDDDSTSNETTGNEPDPGETSGQTDREKIITVINELDKDDEAHWTKAGAPDAKVLSEKTGFNVSATVRDEIWAEMQKQSAE